MQHFFLTDEHALSARWQEAFPNAEVHRAPLSQLSHLPFSFPANTQSICWIYQATQVDELTIAHFLNQSVAVIVMTSAENTEQARKAVELGASGYLHYLSATSLLIQAALVVEQGGLWLGADLMRQIVFATAKQLKASAKRPELNLLTEREKHVAELVAAGKPNKEIARDLAITERTVKAHLSAIFEKLQVRDRLQLVLKMSGN